MEKHIKKEKTSGWLGWLLAAGIAVLLVGCSNQVDLKWQEEVKMADGQILIVNRTAKGQKYGGPWGEGGGWDSKEMSLELVKLPLNWQPPPVWRTEFVPILLDYQPEGRTWSVVATYYTCDGWKKMGSPKLPYTEYQSKKALRCLVWNCVFGAKQ